MYGGISFDGADGGLDDPPEPLITRQSPPIGRVTIFGEGSLLRYILMRLKFLFVI